MSNTTTTTTGGWIETYELWCTNNRVCEYFKDNLFFVFIFIVLLSFTCVMSMVLLRSLTCLKKLWENDIVINESAVNKQKLKNTIRLRINYLKIFSILFLGVTMFISTKLFFQVFEIGSETEYILAILFVTGVAIVNLVQKIMNFFILLFTSKIKYSSYYDFGEGHEGWPDEIDFYHLILRDQKGRNHPIPIADVLGRCKYSFIKDFGFDSFVEVPDQRRRTQYPTDDGAVRGNRGFPKNLTGESQVQQEQQRWAFK